MKEKNIKKDIIIELDDIKKKYVKNNKDIIVLENINNNFKAGHFYAIMGHSGSGKTTLINILGLLDVFDSGCYKLFGKDVKCYDEKEKSYIRMKNIGYIFQNYYLNDNLTACENVMLPMIINKDIERQLRKQNAISLLEKVGLKNRINHYPSELSGGEQQRVAIARSLANSPGIILADEPTGNLDANTEKEIFGLLKKLSKEGKCIIVVSHSELVKEYADYVYKLEKNMLVGD